MPRRTHLQSVEMTSRPVRVFAGPLLSVALLAFAKLTYLAHATTTPAGHVLRELGTQELSAIAALTLVILGASQPRRRWLVLLSSVPIFALSLWYLTDTLSIMLINGRLTLDAIVRLSGETSAVASFIQFGVLSVVIVWAIMQTIRMKMSPKAVRILTGLCIGLVPLSSILTPPAGNLSRLYETPTLRSLIAPLQNEPQAQYSQEQIAYFSKLPGPPPPVWPQNNPDVILLVVESLSSMNSQFFGGADDRMPELDGIAKSGLAFTNFLANYHDTEGGLVALLNMQPPLPAPAESRDIYNLYGYEESIVSFLKARSYQTAFITTADVTFLRKGDYMKRLGFDTVAGRSEVARFRVAPRYSFSAPADEVLYDELLQRVDAFSAGHIGPFFLSAVTVSSHLPWTDPEGISDTPERVWRYVDSQLARFHAELKKRNFFDRGILIITGDHRQMTPVATWEWDAFGGSARNRVPLILVGNSIPAGRVDRRLLQQSDLFRKFGHVTQPGRSLSEIVIVPDRFSKPLLRKGASVVEFNLFTRGGGARMNSSGFLLGDSIVWRPPTPAAAIPSEHFIHRQRALLQERITHEGSDSQPPRCITQLPLHPDAAAGPGFLVRRLANLDILRIDPSTILEPTQRVGQLDFAELRGTTLAPKDDDFALLAQTLFHAPKPGVYFFRVSSDDGACLFVDNRLVVSVPVPRIALPVEGWVQLEQGNYPLELRYFQNGGGATLKLEWNTPEEREWRVLEPHQQ